jgi:hypothetical protein
MGIVVFEDGMGDDFTYNIQDDHNVSDKSLIKRITKNEK